MSRINENQLFVLDCCPGDRGSDGFRISVSFSGPVGIVLPGLWWFGMGLGIQAQFPAGRIGLFDIILAVLPVVLFRLVFSYVYTLATQVELQITLTSNSIVLSEDGP